MAVTSSGYIAVQLTGDTELTDQFDVASNSASPGGESIYTLASGANTITLPTGGATVKGLIIRPPSGNTQTLTLKGVTGDTGIPLHLTDPSYIRLNSAALPASVVLTAGDTITGLRILWV